MENQSWNKWKLLKRWRRGKYKWRERRRKRRAMCSTWVIWLRWSGHFMPPAGRMGGGMRDEDSFHNYHIMSAQKFPCFYMPYLRKACAPVFFNPWWTNNWYGECLQHASPITLPAISRKRLSDTWAPRPWILRHCHALSRPGLGSFGISLDKVFRKDQDEDEEGETIQLPM